MDTELRLNQISGLNYMHKVFLSFVFILSVSGNFLVAQRNNADSLISKFNLYRNNALQEKLYVHLSQNFYLTGETMWFKVYAVDATLHKPIALSKVAYVEILDVNRRPVLQGKIRLNDEGGSGSFFIPATLLSGNYVLRAYTRWMQNFSPEYYFTKNITILNPFISPDIEKKSPTPQINIDFFPEGGNLVAGQRSKIAFKIHADQTDGKITGSVISSNGDTVATFEPHKFGLGHFYLTPVADQDYSCIVEDSKGHKNKSKLPQVYKDGYVMEAIDSLADKLTVNVNMPGHSGALVYLFVHARQMIVHNEAKQGIPERAIFSIDKSKLPDGISHLTVFDNEFNPVCERLYFKKPASKLRLQVSSAQISYLPRSKVSLDVTSQFNNSGLPANLSVAVYRIDSLVHAPTTGIFNYLMLTSDLKGNIESPEYYFSEDAGVKTATDNLMLTHGWRRFNWTSVLTKSYTFDHFPEYRSHIVQGTITANDKAKEGVLAYLASPSKIVNVAASRSNTKGDVFFEMNDFWGQRKLIAQLNNRIDSTYKISITDPFSKNFAASGPPPFAISPNVKSDLNMRSLAMQVQDIYFREVGDRITNKPKKDSTSFYGRPDKTYLLDDYTRFPLLEEVLREYVPTVFVHKRRDNFSFQVVNTLNNKVFPDDPMVLLDGVPIFDYNKLMKYDPRLVKKLEVVSRYYYLGSVRMNGITSYSTYQGNMPGYEIDPRAVVLDYEGLQLQREFYYPKYEDAKQRNSRLPDQRTFLYWEPIVFTSEKGNKTLEFYTSDVSGNFIAVIEGMTAKGHAGSGMVEFKVNQGDF
jgi:hypothetical protein